jgi:hypothetical protein
MTQVILGKSRVREICMPGSVRAKAKWLSYSTNPASRVSDGLQSHGPDSYGLYRITVAGAVVR